MSEFDSGSNAEDEIASLRTTNKRLRRLYDTSCKAHLLYSKVQSLDPKKPEDEEALAKALVSYLEYRLAWVNAYIECLDAGDIEDRKR